MLVGHIRTTESEPMACSIYQDHFSFTAMRSSMIVTRSRLSVCMARVALGVALAVPAALTAQVRVTAPPEILAGIGATGSTGSSTQGQVTVAWKVLDDGTRLIPRLEPLVGDSIQISALPACGATVLCKVAGPDLRPVEARVLSGWNPPLRMVYDVVIVNEGRAASRVSEVKVCSSSSSYCSSPIDVLVLPPMPGRSKVVIRRSLVPQSIYVPDALSVSVDEDALSGDVVKTNNRVATPFPPVMAQAPYLIQLNTSVTNPTTFDARQRLQPVGWSFTLQNQSAGAETGPILFNLDLSLNTMRYVCPRDYSVRGAQVTLPSISPKAIVEVTIALPAILANCRDKNSGGTMEVYTSRFKLEGMESESAPRSEIGFSTQLVPVSK